MTCSINSLAKLTKKLFYATLMSGNHDTKITIRKEIASLIDALKSESDRIGNNNPLTKTSVEKLLEQIATLQRKAIVYSYLDALPEEKTVEEKPVTQMHEAIIVPVPEPIVPKPEIVPPVVFETPIVPPPVVPPVVPPPVVPVIPKTETPTPPPTKRFPDIKTMIGFNERLMFLNHLFKKDALAYEAAIVQLNNCSSFDEATAFVSVLSTEFKWNAESEPVFIFNSIVKRRFA